MANDVKHKVGDTVYWIDLLDDCTVRKGIIEKIRVENMPDYNGEYHDYGIYYLRDAIFDGGGFIMAHQALPKDDVRIQTFEDNFKKNLENDVYGLITGVYGIWPGDNNSDNRFVADILHKLAKKYE